MLEYVGVFLWEKVREQFEQIGALHCLHNSRLNAEVPVSIRSSAMFFVVADLCKDNGSSSCRTLTNRTIHVV